MLADGSIRNVIAGAAIWALLVIAIVAVVQRVRQERREKRLRGFEVKLDSKEQRD